MKQLSVLIILFVAGFGCVCAAGPDQSADMQGATGTVRADTAKKTLLPAVPEDEGEAAYGALTVTADFNYRPAFVETKYSKNELFQDIAVSAVEAVPFGFLLTFAGIYISEMAGQATLQPGLKSLDAYAPVYIISISTLAALNIVINTLFFYDYKKENEDAEKTEEK